MEFLSIAVAVVSVIVGAASWYFNWWATRRVNLTAEASLKEREFLRRQLDALATVEIDRPLPAAPAPADNETSGPQEASVLALPPPPVPAELAQACAIGECVLVAGGGLSAQVGWPTWHRFLQSVVQEVSREDAQRWAGLAELLARGDTTQVAEVFSSRGYRDFVIERAHSIFDAEGVMIPAELTLLGDVPFAGAITWTWDSLLNLLFGKQDPALLYARLQADFSSVLAQKRFFILRLHGDVSTDGSLTFTAQDYQLALRENPAVLEFLGALMATNSLLFIGASTDGIEWFMRSPGPASRSNRRHFALVPAEPNFEIRRELFLSQYNVELLSYGPSKSNQTIRSFIRDLHEQIKARGLPTPERNAGLDRQRLKVIRLENLGPFERLELKLDRQWTVLLGNNGTGKSTILKAIALALAAGDEEAAKLGTSLLSNRAGSGFIEIEVDYPDNPAALPATYRVDLARDASLNRVVVRARQTGLLQSGLLLAVGIPAVRGVGPVRNQRLDTTEARRRPVVKDILPLLDSGADPRGTDVRQWIIRNWARSIDPAQNEAKQTASRALIDRLFAAINRLTPGFDIQFKRCDSDNFRIEVTTSDGDVSLDDLSQGINSTIAWVGVLIQRLFDVHPAAEATKGTISVGPEGSFQDVHGLLLIDEIDSHLHPAWQRALVPALKEVLPKVQVIATSHSPLVVGELEQGEAFRLRRIVPQQATATDAPLASAKNAELARALLQVLEQEEAEEDEEGRGASPPEPTATLPDRGVVAEVLPKSYIGERPDQILTDEPFELSGTRGIEYEKQLSEYLRLMSIPSPNDGVRTRIGALRQRLGAPHPYETPAERLTAALFRRFAEEQIDRLLKLPDDERARLINEMVLHLPHPESEKDRVA